MKNHIANNNQGVKENVEKTDIPSGIVNFLERRAGIRTEYAERSYSVTDLVSCSRKKYYKEIGASKNHHPVDDITVDRLWSTTRGDFLHEITRAYRWRELDIDYDVILKDGRIVRLSGRLDMYDWKSRTIIDLKTTNFVSWQIKNNHLPRSEHILQIQCYGTMFSHIIPIENLNLVYADMTNLYAFKVNNVDRTAWITERIQSIEDALDKNKPPDAEISGLCQFCKYQNRCTEDGTRVSVEDLKAFRGEGN